MGAHGQLLITLKAQHMSLKAKARGRENLQLLPAVSPSPPSGHHGKKTAPRHFGGGQRQVCSQPATKTKRTEGANRKFYHKEILVNAYQAQGNALLPKPTFRKLPLDLALGKPCNQQWQESFLSCRETWGECFPRYSFSITLFFFFSSVIVHNTYLNDVFLRICIFSLSLARLSRQRRVQPSGCRWGALWKVPGASPQGGGCPAHAAAPFTPLNIPNMSSPDCVASLSQLSRAVYSGHPGEVPSR